MNLKTPGALLALLSLVFILASSSLSSSSSEAATLPPLPSDWPDTLQLGMADGADGAAAMQSTAPFGFRYQYLAGGSNTSFNWTDWNADGHFVTFYIDDSADHDVTPVFTYYMIVQSAPGNSQSEPDGVYTNLQNTTTMTAYFNDLKLFFQRAGAFPSTPVVLHVEPDMWGFMQQRATGDDASTVAAKVAATGLSDLAGLPNNMRGVAQAVVRLRDTYAPNVILGYHLSVWGTGVDVALSNPSMAVVDQLATRAANYYNSLLAPFDFVVSEFSDRDAAFKQYVYGDGGASWWDANDFARNVRFLSTFVSVAQKRVVMWQIPYGNTKMRAMNNTTGHYQDNRVEWLLDDPTRNHIMEYIDAGVIAFWFGQGAGGTTCPCDAMADGVTNPSPINGNNLASLNSDDDGGFFKQKAAAYYSTGALSLGGDVGPYGVSWTSDNTPASMNAGATSNVSLSFTNTGSSAWNATGANPVRLSYHWRTGACPGSGNTVWDGLRTLLPGNVNPGASVPNLAAQVKAPSPAGTYCLQFDLVKEGVAWFSSQGANVLSRTVTVSASTFGVSWTNDNTPASMSGGATSNVTLSFTNTGTSAWNASGANPVRVAYHWRASACPGSGNAVWDGLRTVLPGNVNPGGSVSNLVTQVRAPSPAGTYCLQFDLVKEGVAWFSTQGANVLSKTVSVSASTFGVSWTSDNTPASMNAGATQNVTLSFSNTGTSAWNASGANPVRLSYHWRTGACPGTGNAVWDGLRTLLPTNVNTGGSVSNLAAQVKAPSSAGTYCLQFDLVKEGVAWFSTQGANVLSKTVTIN